MTPKKDGGLTEACVNGKPMLIFFCRNLDTENILTKKNTETANGIQTIPFTSYDVRFRGSPATNQTSYLLF
jgi:hypothetical protein